MMNLLLFSLLFLLGVKGQESSVCPHPCTCNQGHVNCSHKSLTSSMLPSHFPPGTTQVNLNNNLLTILPNGLLEDLPNLHSVTLHGNLWACDCGVLYLRALLTRQPSSVLLPLNVSCTSPSSLSGRLVMHLTEEEVLEFCHYWYCDLALVSQVCLFVFVLLQVLLLLAVIVFLRRFERLSREARRTKVETSAFGESVMENEYKALKESRT